MPPYSATVNRHARLLGDHIRTWRKLQGLRMEDLAERAGISRALLGRLENGNTSISLGAFLEVARCLGQLDAVTKALDPYESDLGRLRADEQLPIRVR